MEKSNDLKKNALRKTLQRGPASFGKIQLPDGLSRENIEEFKMIIFPLKFLNYLNKMQLTSLSLDFGN